LKLSKLITPGEPAPDFELMDVDGNQVRLATYQGKPVLLAFLRGFM
jgi:peroxiredoxin